MFWLFLYKIQTRPGELLNNNDLFPTQYIFIWNKPAVGLGLFPGACSVKSDGFQMDMNYPTRTKR